MLRGRRRYAACFPAPFDIDADLVACDHRAQSAAEVCGNAGFCPIIARERCFHGTIDKVYVHLSFVLASQECRL